MKVSKVWRVTASWVLVSAPVFAAVDAKAGELLAQEEVIGEDGYNKTYNDDSKTFQERMKGARSTPVVTTSNERGGFYLGVNGMFGPVYDAEPKGESGFGFGFGVEPGFVIQSESWSRFEIGLQVAYNSFSWKVDKNTNTIDPLSFMPTIGWGYSLGNNLYGVMKLGFGFATGEMKGKVGGETTTYKGSNGTLFGGSYDLVYAAGKAQFVGGLGVTHFKYSWSKASNSAGSGDVDEVTNLNFVNLHGGVRFQF